MTHDTCIQTTFYGVGNDTLFMGIEIPVLDQTRFFTGHFPVHIVLDLGQSTLGVPNTDITHLTL